MANDLRLRDDKGHFLKGSPQPPKPFQDEVKAKRQALQEATTEEQVTALFNSIYEDAMNAEDNWVKIANRSLWLSYVLGKPTANVQIDKNQTVTKVDLKAFDDETLRAIDALTRNPELAQKINTKERIEDK